MTSETIEPQRRERPEAAPNGSAVTDAGRRGFLAMAFTRPSVPMTLSLIAGALLLAAWVGESFLGLVRPVALPLYVGAYLAGGFDVSRHALRALAKGRFDIDVLMVVAALGATGLGEWAEGALLLFLFSFGHALQHMAMDRARNAIRALAGLVPKTARVRRDGAEVEVPLAEITIGDLVVVRAGERVPADGQVREGSSSVDQAPITGESIPVAKSAGSPVFAGTINGAGSLVVETTKRSEESVLARVIDAVQRAQKAKGATQRFTERFERVFVPTVLIGAVLVLLVPPLFGVAFSDSLLRALTVLVAASPCALALATPSAVLAGIARAARGGVLVKGGVHLENAGVTRVVAFDKTGTLTRGEPMVTDVLALEASEDELLAQVAAVEARTTHPLGRAVVQHAEARGLALPAVEAFEAVDGRGVRARLGGDTLAIGNRAWMRELGSDLDARSEEAAERWEADGKTVMLVARGSRVVGLVAVRDELRQEAVRSIATAKRLGVKRVVMLTGDNHTVARAIAREVGVDEVEAGLLPDEKVNAVRRLREAHGYVMMVGDGVNDAPAMATASVGVAMGGAGTDVALETADIVLMADDLTKLPLAMALSRASRRMMMQNLAVSLGVIALLVPSAVLGLVGIGWAIVLHEGSTLVVVANALRLLAFRLPVAAS